MLSSTFSSMMSFASYVWKVVPLELSIITFAFTMHFVIFGYHHIKKGKAFQKNTSPKKKKSPEASPKSASSGASGVSAVNWHGCGVKDNNSPYDYAPFTTAAEKCCRTVSDRQTLTASVRRELQQVPPEHRVNALTNWLQEDFASGAIRKDVLLVAQILLEETRRPPTMLLGAHLAHGLILNGDMNQALRIIAKMRSAGRQPNLIACNRLLDAAVKFCPMQVWDLLMEMKRCGVKPDKHMCDILLKTIDTGFVAQHIERIMLIVNDIHEHMDESLLANAIEACLYCHRPELVVPYIKPSVIRSMQLKSPVTYGHIIRANGVMKNLQAVWDTWHEMRARPMAPHSITLGCMVEALITNDNVEAGYQFLLDVSKEEDCSDHINAVIYGSVLKGFAQKKNFERVWCVYQEMLEKHMQLSIVTFNTLVDACARCNEMSRVPVLLQSMVTQGIEPNVITYSSIVKGYCQANRLDEAFRLLEQMHRTTGLKPDEIMYNTLFDGCARQCLYDKGMELLEEMQQNGLKPTCYTLSVVVKLASRSKKLDRAFELCDEISAKYKFKLNYHVYSNLVHSCVMNKDFPRGVDVLEKMISEKIRPDTRTYESLLRTCVMDKRAQDAAGLLAAALGLRNVHPKLVGHPASLLQPHGKWTNELIESVLDMIGSGNITALASQLSQDLRRVPGYRLDPKVHKRFNPQ